MKTDCNPSLILGLYCKPEKYKELLDELKKRSLPVRELRLIDISIPLDDNYNGTINWLKEFINLEYWKGRNILNKIPFIDSILRKAGFHRIEIKKGWMNRKQHNLLWTLAVPLMIQNQLQNCETEQEKKNMENLFHFESDGYKDDEDLIAEEIEKEMKEIESNNNN